MRRPIFVLLALIGLCLALPRSWSQAGPPPPPPPVEADQGDAPLPPPPPEASVAPAAPEEPVAEGPPLHEHGQSPLADLEHGSGGLPSPAAVFSASFMRRALLAGLLVSAVCAFVGVFVVLKRIVFVGVALAEISSAGVALSLLMGWNPFVGSVTLMLLGIALFSVRWAPKKVSPEAFIGIGWAVASAFGVLFIAKSAQGEGHMHDLLFGNILTVERGDVVSTSIGLALVVAVHALFAKEFLFISFDPETASAAGYRARLWEFLLYVTIGLAIAFSIHTVGVLLTFAALVLPPVSALLVTRRMRSTLAASVALAMVPVPLGLYLSFVRDLPSSAAIVAVMFVLLLLTGGVGYVRRSRR